MSEKERIKKVLSRIHRTYRLQKMKNGEYREVDEKCIIYEPEEGYDLKPKKDESI